jgi:hypothetical protein
MQLRDMSGYSLSQELDCVSLLACIITVGGNNDQICVEERLCLRNLASDIFSGVMRVLHGVNRGWM